MHTHINEKKLLKLQQQNVKRAGEIFNVIIYMEKNYLSTISI